MPKFLVDARNMKTVAPTCIVINSLENVMKIQKESERKVLMEAKKNNTSLCTQVHMYTTFERIEPETPEKPDQSGLSREHQGEYMYVFCRKLCPSLSRMCEK